MAANGSEADYPMKITYYFEVFSSWCHWVEPAWAQLQTQYERRVKFEWKIALMNPGDIPTSRADIDWYYQRSGGTLMNSPYKLNSGWFDPAWQGDYRAPNLVAEAGKEFGVTDDRIRLALAHAALREGAAVRDMALAAEVGAKAVKLDAKKLRTAAESPAVLARVQASTAEFFAHQINQRPGFILTDLIGDKAVFSGLAVLKPLVATIDAMLADTAGYASHRAHFGAQPKG